MFSIQTDFGSYWFFKLITLSEIDSINLIRTIKKELTEWKHPHTQLRSMPNVCMNESKKKKVWFIFWLILIRVIYKVFSEKNKLKFNNL